MPWLRLERTVKNAAVLGEQYSIRNAANPAVETQDDGKLPLRTRVLILAGAGLGAWILVGAVGYGLYMMI